MARAGRHKKLVMKQCLDGEVLSSVFFRERADNHVKLTLAQRGHKRIQCALDDGNNGTGSLLKEQRHRCWDQTIRRVWQRTYADFCFGCVAKLCHCFGRTSDFGKDCSAMTKECIAKPSRHDPASGALDQLNAEVLFKLPNTFCYGRLGYI